MAQPSITSFFPSRKRAAPDDLHSARSKLLALSSPASPTCPAAHPSPRTPRTLRTLRQLELVSDGSPCPAPAPRSPRPRAVAKLTFDVVCKENGQTASPTESVTKEAAHKPEACDEKCSPVKAFARKQSSNIKVCSSDPARKELSLGDLRSKLLGSSRLAELKASAARLDKGFQKLKELENRKSLQGKSITVEVPISPSKKLHDGFLSPKKESPVLAPVEKLAMSPRKVAVSPVKSPTKVPAYIRHASLASTSALLLPHHYKFLAEVFRGIETVSSLLFNRKEKITFEKLRPSVQEMLKRNVTVKHLAQIKHIAPEFYNVEVQKVKSFSATEQKQKYEMLVSPALPQDVGNMNPTILLERRRQFFDRLMSKVKQHHSKFLLSLDPPMIIPDDKIARWHPEFELEKVPEVECAKLPELPNQETYSTAEDVLTKARELFNCNTRMERALEKLIQAKARGLTEQEKIATGLTNGPSDLNSVACQANIPTSAKSTKNVPLLNPALRNLPTALLEKIKAKQAAKALEAMTRSTEDEKKWIVYSRLPDLARTLRNIYVTERKNVLALNVVVSKLDSTFQSKVSAPDLRGDIKVLSEVLPEWVSLSEIRNTTYLKLDRSANLEEIKTKLQALADKYKNL